MSERVRRISKINHQSSKLTVQVQALQFFAGFVKQARNVAGQFVEKQFGRRERLERHGTVGQLAAEYADAVDVGLGIVATKVLFEQFGSVPVDVVLGGGRVVVHHVQPATVADTTS